jgi:hypothetical protein
MSDHVTVVLTRNEAAAALDALDAFKDYTRAELRDQLGWNRHDGDAGREAAVKLDRALRLEAVA